MVFGLVFLGTTIKGPFTISSNVRSNVTFESANLIKEILNNYSENFDDDYEKQRENIVKDMAVQEVKKLAKKYLDPDKMIYLIVGNAATKLK